MITALYGTAPYRCTRVSVDDVKGDLVLVSALTAWHDTDFDGPAERWVSRSELSDIHGPQPACRKILCVGRIHGEVNVLVVNPDLVHASIMAQTKTK